MRPDITRVASFSKDASHSQFYVEASKFQKPVFLKSERPLCRPVLVGLWAKASIKATSLQVLTEASVGLMQGAV